jgi:HEAT repeat protein
MLEVFLEQSPDRLGFPTGRAGIDRFHDGLGLLVARHPAMFIDIVRGHPLPWPHQRMTVAIWIGLLGDPANSAIPCAFLGDADWLVRLHATRALGRLGDERSRVATEQMLTDPNLSVRLAALQALSQWDPQRALPLYERFLQRGRVVSRRAPSPLLRAEATADLIDLRAGRRPSLAGRP